GPWRRWRSSDARLGWETASAAAPPITETAPISTTVRRIAVRRAANSTSTAAVSTHATRSKVAIAAPTSSTPTVTALGRSSVPCACSASVAASAQTQTSPSAGGYSSVPWARQTPAIRSASGSVRSARPARPVVATVAPSSATSSASSAASRLRALAATPIRQGTAIAASTGAIDELSRCQASEATAATAAAVSPAPSSVGRRSAPYSTTASAATAASANWAGDRKPPCHSINPSAGATNTPMGECQIGAACRSEPCNQFPYGGLFMSVSRLLVIVPVFAGLIVTGTAVARMMPAESVRDSVYQTCAHNGVHFNKQGHSNCGLHKGWSQGDPVTEPDQPATEPGTGDTGG